MAVHRAGGDAARVVEPAAPVPGLPSSGTCEEAGDGCRGGRGEADGEQGERQGAEAEDRPGPAMSVGLLFCVWGGGGGGSVQKKWGHRGGRGGQAGGFCPIGLPLPVGTSSLCPLPFPPKAVPLRRGRRPGSLGLPGLWPHTPFAYVLSVMRYLAI